MGLGLLDSWERALGHLFNALMAWRNEPHGDTGRLTALGTVFVQRDVNIPSAQSCMLYIDKTSISLMLRVEVDVKWSQVKVPG